MLGMRTQPGRSFDLDSPWRPLDRAGGACAAIAVAMYVAALVLFVATTAPPTSGGEYILRYIDAHRTTYVIRQLLWLAPSLFLMVGSLALAVSLRILQPEFCGNRGNDRGRLLGGVLQLADDRRGLAGHGPVE